MHAITWQLRCFAYRARDIFTASNRKQSAVFFLFLDLLDKMRQISYLPLEERIHLFGPVTTRKLIYLPTVDGLLPCKFHEAGKLIIVCSTHQYAIKLRIKATRIQRKHRIEYDGGHWVGNLRR